MTTETFEHLASEVGVGFRLVWFGVSYEVEHVDPQPWKDGKKIYRFTLKGRLAPLFFVEDEKVECESSPIDF